MRDCPVPVEIKAQVYLKCIGHLSCQLRGHAGQQPGAISRTIQALRGELDRMCHLGGKLPQVANLDHAEQGSSEDLSTLLDVAEITFDTILDHSSISRGRRYKSNEFASSLERSIQQRNHHLSLEYTTLKTAWDLRTRQLGCLLSAAGTMLLTPLELRTLLLSLLTEDLLEKQEHLFSELQERPRLLAQVLLDLGLSASLLAQHFGKTLKQTPTTRIEPRCDRFQQLMEGLGLDSSEFQRDWQRIKHNSLTNRTRPTKQFRDDGQGGWEEQLEGDSSRNGWTTWVAFDPPGKHDTKKSEPCHTAIR